MGGSYSKVALARVCAGISAGCDGVSERCKRASKRLRALEEPARAAQPSIHAGQSHVDALAARLPSSDRPRAPALVSRLPPVPSVAHEDARDNGAIKRQRAQGAASEPGASNYVTPTTGPLGQPAKEPETKGSTASQGRAPSEGDAVDDAAEGKPLAGDGPNPRDEPTLERTPTRSYRVVEEYYIIWLVEGLDEPGGFYLRTRWGRVGRPGQQELLGTNKTGKKRSGIRAEVEPWTEVEDAIKAFKAKYKEQTGCTWGTPADSFQRRQDKYQPQDVEAGLSALDLPERLSEGRAALQRIQDAIEGKESGDLVALASRRDCRYPDARTT
eukprot:jgi/Mesvir1/12213/Mv00441-RA.1